MTCVLTFSTNHRVPESRTVWPSKEQAYVVAHCRYRHRLASQGDTFTPTTK